LTTSNFLQKTSLDIGTSVVSIGGYTVPASTQTIVIGLTVSNKTTSTIQVSISYYNGTTDAYVVKNASIVPGGSIVAAGGNQKIVMAAGSSVRVISSAATSADAIMSILEIGP
jgi:hypothetical protein